MTAVPFSLPPAIRTALRADSRRIVLVGASGWIGQTVCALLDEALGEAVADRLVCVGSAERTVTLPSGRTVVQRALSTLADLPERPSLLLHLAFLTKDKVSGMSREAYVEANKALTRQVYDALEPIGVDRLFIASSGAAAFADDVESPEDLRLYGRLKRDDEDLFAGWADADPTRRRAAICRIYSVSGPFINKHDTYALANFIISALRSDPIAVRAPREVWRSYVAVKEVVAVAFGQLLAADGPAVQRFDSGGEPLELGHVARIVAEELGGEATGRPITETPPNRYCGDHPGWLALLRKNGLEHIGLPEQVRETARFLASLEAGSIRV